MVAAKMKFNVLDVVGMDLPEAKTYIFNRGLRFRVVEEDGTKFKVAEDTRSDRVNLTVLAGTVLRAHIG